MIINTISIFLSKNNISNCKILLAISGGRDSMTLLNAMLRLRQEYNIKLGVAYVNHNLRDDSYDEQKFIANTVSSIDNIEFYEHIVDKKYWEQNKNSIEEKARKIRYDFFEKVAADYNFDYIATAHHLDDKIETFFINLLRGGGVETLCSIRQINGKIIRPLLNISRDEINQYISQNGIKFIDDYTNNQNDYLRNKIRHNIIPQLSEITPHYRKSIYHIFDYLTENVQAIDYFTDSAFNSCLKSQTANEIIINRDIFDTYPIAVRKNVIKLIIEKLNYPTEINLPLLTTLTAIKPQRINFCKGSLRAISKGKELRIARE